eukprot:TRINITY_DN50237_c0_g1_i1.p1 TRINITY_DN50237_c0_g1~~TRINITY_DN50237_c0_g1_i1.p1  ORF type:complete len:431 (+),score=48.13 TRINITY_DN50237_c0_g1_i1:70-1362(+)
MLSARGRRTLHGEQRWQQHFFVGLLVFQVSASTTLRIVQPRHGARLTDEHLFKVISSLEGPAPEGAVICIELERESRSDSVLPWVTGGVDGCRNTTAWREGLCRSGEGSFIVSSSCYSVRDPRWRQLAIENFEPTCTDVCRTDEWLGQVEGVTPLNCAYAPRCLTVALRLTIRLLGHGTELSPPARTRFFLLGSENRALAFPGGARDAIGNIQLSNLCRIDWQGQLAQDALALGLRHCKKEGFYLDIGANDGEYHSNTAVLDRAGWSGLCVDPFPLNMRNRSCQVVQVALYNTSGQLVEFATAGEFGGIVSKAAEKRWESGPTTAALASSEMRTNASIVRLFTERLDVLLEAVGAPSVIDYMSVDVEGMEVEVLQGFPFKTHVARVVTVEHNQDNKRRDLIWSLLRENGYTYLGQLRWDDVYVYQLTYTT